jgi:hypothetical protein
MRANAGENEFYVEYFQQPGRAEADIKPTRGARFLWCASGVLGRPGAFPSWSAARRCATSLFIHRMPKWLSDTDLDVYTRGSNTPDFSALMRSERRS